MVKQYLDHSKAILTSDRTNFKGGSKEMALISLFGYQNEYKFSEGFPLLTTKKMAYKGIIHELLWFMRGETNIKYLVDNNVPIWNDNVFDHNLKEMVKEKIFPESVLVRYSPEWKTAMGEYVQKIKEDAEFAQRWGEAGPIYGSQWRKWKYVNKNNEVREVDQFQKMIEVLKDERKRTSKKNIVVAWHPGQNEEMALPPCHVMYQVTANEEGEVELMLTQRSCDQFLGVPFNIASYYMLTETIAQQAELEAKTFIHTFADAHFYAGDGARAQWYKDNFQGLKLAIKEAERLERRDGWRGGYKDALDWINNCAPPEREETKGQDHVTAIIEQLAREPRALPTLEIAKKPFDKLTIDDFVLEGYDPHPAIKRAMAV